MIVYEIVFVWLYNLMVGQTKFDAKWNARVSRLIKNESVTHVDDGMHTCKIGGEEIWIANYPYSFGCPRGTGTHEQCKLLGLSATNIVRLKRKVNAHLKANKLTAQEEFKRKFWEGRES